MTTKRIPLNPTSPQTTNSPEQQRILNKTTSTTITTSVHQTIPTELKKKLEPSSNQKMKLKKIKNTPTHQNQTISSSTKPSKKKHDSTHQKNQLVSNSNSIVKTNPEIRLNPIILAHQIREYIRISTPNPTLLIERKKLVERLSEIINRSKVFTRKPGTGTYRLEVFGSIYFGLDSINSDLDISIIDPDRPQGLNKGETELKSLPPIYNVRKLGKLLYDQGIFKQVKPIPGARTPIVKFLNVNNQAKISVDLNCNNLLGCRNSRLIKAYSNLSSTNNQKNYFIQLAMIIKLWAKSRGFCDPSGQNGPISASSYTLILLLIAYLQVINHLPNLQDPEYLLNRFDPRNLIHVLKPAPPNHRKTKCQSNSSNVNKNSNDSNDSDIHNDNESNNNTNNPNPNKINNPNDNNKNVDNSSKDKNHKNPHNNKKKRKNYKTFRKPELVGIDTSFVESPPPRFNWKQNYSSQKQDQNQLDDTLIRMLIGFFEFYYLFDFDNYLISIRDGKPLKRDNHFDEETNLNHHLDVDGEDDESDSNTHDALNSLRSDDHDDILLDENKHHHSNLFRSSQEHYSESKKNNSDQNRSSFSSSEQINFIELKKNNKYQKQKYQQGPRKRERDDQEKQPSHLASQNLASLRESLMKYGQFKHREKSQFNLNNINSLVTKNDPIDSSIPVLDFNDLTNSSPPPLLPAKLPIPIPPQQQQQQQKPKTQQPSLIQRVPTVLNWPHPIVVIDPFLYNRNTACNIQFETFTFIRFEFSRALRILLHSGSLYDICSPFIS